MKKTILAALCLLCGLMTANATVVNYTADDETIFSNPERGFITMLEAKSTSEKPYHAVWGEEESLDAHVAQDNLSLILVEYYLNEFRNTGTLPEEVLNAFDTDMELLRQRGLKAIIRFAYTFSDEGEIGHDASLDIIEQHIAQYKSHWEANADVIFCFQAGFIGSWGEWYYTEHFGNKGSHMNHARKQFLDTLLAAVPQDRCIQIRTPLFKTEYLDSLGVSQNALTPEEAYTGLPKARIGHHNDAFLYGAYNQGTYRDTATQKPYIAQETLFVPIGGESNIENSDDALDWASHDATVAEMSRLHWTFIQSGFSKTVTDMWRKNGTFAELNRNLGYRYELVNATLPDEADAGATIDIALNIRNVGYAPLYNERHAYLVLMNADDSIAILLDSDPRTWLPNGVTTAINEQITIPNDVPDGSYNLYLNLPDAYASLAHDPRYSVRFANKDTWNASNGLNDLNASIEISSYVPPTPPPTPYAGTTELPGLVAKTNYTACSDDMTMFGDYFDLGPTDAPNTSRWIEWQVEIKYPTEYTISEVSYCTNGHTFTLELYDGANLVSSYTTQDKYWGIGEQDYTQDAKWDLSGVTPKTYTLRVHNSTEYGQPKLKSLTLDCDIPAAAVALPATLNKANVTAYSDDMTWYNTDYFDFGPNDAPNTDRWAEWTVELKYPGQYIISEIGYCANGHSYLLELMEGSSVISSFTAVDTDHWGEGAQSYTQEEKWDLSAIQKKVYTLRVKNNTEWGQPKLKSLTLEYDGELPAAIETPMQTIETQAYDILGRPVGKDYHGIVIQNGKKRIQ